jgi:hypothetical protein
MKNYALGLLIVFIIVLSSLLYKEKIKQVSIYGDFPVVETKSSETVHFHLYVFFSKRNCFDCLGYIRELNHLPPEIAVFGIVPENELKDEAGLRELTGAAFPLLGNTGFKDFIPLYSPTTIGVSTRGDIFFIMPGVPNEKEYIEKFLLSFYYKMLRYFTPGKI